MQEPVRSTIQKRDARGTIRHGAEWLALWSDPDSMKTSVELQREAAERNAALMVEHRLAAAARSLSGDPDMQISFGPGGAGDTAVFERLQDASSKAAQLAALRGQIDSYALVQRFHAPALHGALAPAGASERMLFDLCEEVRCEALGALHFPGVVANLVACQHERLARSDLLNAHLASLIPLAEGLRMVLRDTLLASADPSISSSGFWMWDQWIRARFASHLIGLKSSMADQSAYAPLSRSLIEGLIEELGSAEGKERRFQPTANRSKAGPEEGLGIDRMQEDEKGDVFEPGGPLFLDDAASSLDRILHQTERPPAPAYAAYTTAHDLVVRSVDLVDNSTLRKERAGLERRRAEFRRDFSRLVSKLQRKLLARQTRNWSFDLDEGLVDASRLDRVVVNPGFASAYKQEQESEFRDTVVSILIDNSGSMRGKPIEIACLASDMIAAALERCSVSCEILGFTTRGWKGGDSAKDWARAGRAGKSGKAERHAAHHLQVRRRADAPRAAGCVRHARSLDPEGEHRRRGAAVGFPAIADARRKPQAADRHFRRRAGRPGDGRGKRRQGNPRPAFARGDRPDRSDGHDRTRGNRRQA